MKANQAPKKLYYAPYGDMREDYPITDNDIEYVRKDAFIEKACDYINEHIEYYMKKDKACNVPLCPQFATKSFVDNFKKYMATIYN